jgi:polyferredoxin
MSETLTTIAPVAAPRSAGRATLLAMPVFLWSALMFSRFFSQPALSQKLGGLVTMIFMVFLFYKMMRTGETHRWRRWFFAALGFLFPVGFIYSLVVMRGSMGIPVEEMIAGRTPFCFMPIPTLILPAALTRTIAFPGSIDSPMHGIAIMVGLWLALTLVVGKGWCSYACFFGGIEEGFSAVAKRPVIKKFKPWLRLIPWAVLLTISLITLAFFEPAYCTWLCPFKAVTEYVQPRDFMGYVQNGIFLLLFAGLVVVMPLLTKRRTQCGWLCPFGAFQSIFNKISVFDIRIDRNRCTKCMQCEKTCPNFSLTRESIEKGGTHLSCMKCGACVDTCKKGAAQFHIRGTEVGIKPERARLLFLYGAWAMATMFGGSILANSMATIFHFVIG